MSAISQHDIVVRVYMWWLAKTFRTNPTVKVSAPVMRLDGKQRHLTDDEMVTATQPLINIFHHVHVFEFSAKDYVEMHAVADEYTVRKVAKLDWPIDKGDTGGYPASNNLNNIPEDEMLVFQKKVFKATVNVPFPENLPFQSMYLAWGSGVSLNQGQFEISTATTWWDETQTCRIAATVVLESGHVYGLYVREGCAKDKHVVVEPLILVERTPELGWMNPMSLTPWVITQTIEAINECDTLIAAKQALSTRLDFKRISKRVHKRIAPPPFYPVYMKQLTMEQRTVTLGQRHIEWSHRWDVRGHWVIKMYRGPIPIEPNLQAKLTQYGYSFFHSMNPIDAESLGILVKRGLAGPEEGEWMAIKKTWRQEFVKGPADKPYIPSTHILKATRPDKAPGV
jgi:hypothetical protein